MKISRILILLIILTMLFSACSQTIDSGIITPKDALDMIDKKNDTILLDVRTPQEYREKRIPGSVLLPDYELEDKIGDVVKDKNTPIIVYCRSGRRSANSAKLLIELGYKKVYDLGGIIDWPYDTISGD